MTDTRLRKELFHHYNQGGTWATIKHPILFAVPFFDTPEEISRVNKLFGIKRIAVQAALERNNFGEYVFLHERPYRCSAFVDIRNELDNKCYWELLREIWTDCENIYQNRMQWWELLTAPRQQRHLFMNSVERKALAKFDDPFYIYRGTTDLEMEDNTYLGCSWTIYMQRAASFATRFQREGERPMIATTLVSRDDCIGYLMTRGEDEIVIANGRTRHSSQIEWEYVE